MGGVVVKIMFSCIPPIREPLGSGTEPGSESGSAEAYRIRGSPLVTEAGLISMFNVIECHGFAKSVYTEMLDSYVPWKWFGYKGPWCQLP